MFGLSQHSLSTGQDETVEEVILAGASKCKWEGYKLSILQLYEALVYVCWILNCPSHFLFLLTPPPRWWAACAQRGSVGSSVGTLQTYVLESPVSEGWSASRWESPTSSPVESVLRILSPMEKRDISALSMVCGTLQIFVRRIFAQSHYQIW